MKKLITKYSFDIPQSLLDQEKTHLFNRFAKDYQSRGLEVPEINEDIAANIDKRSETNVRASVILGKIAGKEGIYATEKDVDSALYEMAAMYRIPFDQFKQTYQENNMLEGLESRLTEQKVLDFIIEKAKITEKKPSKSKKKSDENEIDIDI